MDSGHKSKRRFPGHTDAELRKSLERTDLPEEKRALIVAELAARADGTSKHFKVPQVSGGKPIYKVGRM